MTNDWCLVTTITVVVVIGRKLFSRECMAKQKMILRCILIRKWKPLFLLTQVYPMFGHFKQFSDLE